MLIIQAYENNTTPAWIQRCIESVKSWAAASGYDYCFSPLLFDRVPDWFRDRCGPEIGPMTDLGRLCLMQHWFEQGASPVVWVDADVLVFDPQHLSIPPGLGFLAIDEITVGCGTDRIPVVLDRSVNGAVLGASRGNATFALYRDAIESLVRDAPEGRLPRTIAGPQLLSRLAKQHPIDCLTTVGLFTLPILNDIAQGLELMPRVFSQSFGHRVAAANLCHFFRDIVVDSDVPHYDAIMEQAIIRLLETRGEVVNQHLPLR